MTKPKKGRPGDKLTTKESVKARYENLSNGTDDEDRGSFEDIVESKIQEAMAQGKFDHLSGRGKPIDLKSYYDIPEHLRVAYHFLKNSGFLPKEIQIKKDIEAVKDKLKKCKSKMEKRELENKLSKYSEQFNFLMEYNKTFKNT